MSELLLVRLAKNRYRQESTSSILPWGDLGEGHKFILMEEIYLDALNEIEQLKETKHE